MEEANEVRHTRFEEMAAKFGFSSSLEFAEHVTSISKEERKALLEEFNGVSSKEKGTGKSKAMEKGRASVKVKRSEDPGMSLSSGVGSSRRKRTPVNKTARSASKRAPAKRKPKRLEYLEQNSPHTSPTNRAEEECLTSEEPSSLGLATDTGLARDHRQTEGSSKVCSHSVDSTFLDNGVGNELLDSQQMHRETGGNKLLERKSPRCLGKGQSQSLYVNIDGNSLVDKLFEDSQSMASLSCSAAVGNSAAASKSAAPTLSSDTCSPSVSIMGKVQLQSDNKSILNTNLDIDELLFGF